MSTGLLALVDDVAAIAKVAAASLDDVAAQTVKAGTKAAGVVIDDAAVTPRYLTGFAAERELPIVWRIARGSIRNKMLFLLPAAVALGAFAPWLITPLLMLGGLYLSYEGAEKVLGAVFPHAAHKHEKKAGLAPSDPQALEDQKVRSAVRTDFILSAEIMAIALATLPGTGIFNQIIVLALVGLAITVGVYGAVALLVKADDMGLALAQNGRTRLGRSLGAAVVRGMPAFMRWLSALGTVAMLWVGGGILLHGLEQLGYPAPYEFVHHIAVAAGHAVPVLHGAVEWLVQAAISGLVGLVLGLLVIPLVQLVGGALGGGGKAHA